MLYCTQYEWDQKIRELKIARILNDPIQEQIEIWLSELVDIAAGNVINITNPKSTIEINYKL